MSQLNLIPIITTEVPSKTQLDIHVADFLSNADYNPTQKYIAVKTLEYTIQQALKALKEDAVTCFLKLKEGLMSDYYFGANVKITNARKDTIRKSYSYSDDVKKIEEKIEKKNNEIQVLQKQLKLRQAFEINHNIATCKEEKVNGVDSFGITITLMKNK